MYWKRIEFIRHSGFMDEKWYMKRYPDVARSGLDPVVHYVKYGEAWGRMPSRFFDPRYYVSTYPDVAQSGESPLIHYLMHGIHEDRLPASKITLNAAESAQMKSRRTKKKQQQRIKDLVARAYNLEFSNVAIPELETIARDESGLARQFALWELGLWYAGQQAPSAQENAVAFFQAYIESTQEEAAQVAAKKLLSQLHARLGQLEEGRHVLASVPASLRDDDWLLGHLNLATTSQARLELLSSMYQQHGLEGVRFKPEHSQVDAPASFYERVTADTQGVSPSNTLVSVIIPAYNAATMLPTALESLLAQSHQALEILVSDDASTDDTVAVAKRFAAQDSRVRVLTTATNEGPYAARNRALDECRGEFVTTHDADDWSHPRKIEIQVAHLKAHSDVIANCSSQIRLREDGGIYLRPKSTTFLLMNLSSLMFRRGPVGEALGYWDKVRFAADSEFLARLRQVFGEQAVVTLGGAPLCFQRQAAGSLTADSDFGYLGYKTGARKEYDESAAYWRKRAGESTAPLRYGKEGAERQFARPSPMLPDKGASRTHFDVIIASDFRLPGGTSHSNIEEIKAQRHFGLRTGLLNLLRYDLNPGRTINESVRDLVDGENVAFIVAGERVTCDHLVIRHPPVVQHLQDRLPQVEAARISVIVNQPPKREYSETGATLYDIPTCNRHILQAFGKEARWYPIGPLVRASLHDHHASELAGVDLADEDWVNIINVDEWQRPAHTVHGAPIRIGRHSRDQYVKWPESAQVLSTLYPEDERFAIHVLGGAQSPTQVLGHLPGNWVVHEFGSLHPAQFLRELDFYVYYTHSDWIEAFGRVMFEAMAVGVPVIIDPKYKPLFGDAAVYARPEEVITVIEAMANDPARYQQQVELALGVVRNLFGYRVHLKRLGLIGKTVSA
ncbi:MULTISPECIES: glycosyltransferase [unclassified Halomonas]|uniref:glycosyltransferase n=1 Tax=unclassified Halomonas TaxID=2609666 RepID=UPI0020769BBE|nr:MULTISPECIES: glycosyltransferase [unclassified Halomonas]